MMQLAANETQPTATKPTTASNRKQMMRIHLIQSIEAFVFVLLNFNMWFINLLNLIKIISGPFTYKYNINQPFLPSCSPLILLGALSPRTHKVPRTADETDTEKFVQSLAFTEPSSRILGT